mmetsp:Transcript_39426/g.92661  ORF Transcript_39426/g.92661 Transcript_39426/m.92661 type:complete len:224 (+) Transcript_39426:716-1387(+)
MPFWSRLAGTSPPCPWPTRSPSSEVSSCISSLAWLSFPGAPWSTTNGGSATPSSPLLSASSSPRSALLSSVGLSSSSSSAPSPPPTSPKRLSGTSSSSSPRWRGRHCTSSLPIHPTACSRTIKPNSLGLRSPPSTRCTTLPSSSSACPPASAGCSGPLWETRDLAGSRAPTPYVALLHASKRTHRTNTSKHGKQKHNADTTPWSCTTNSLLCLVELSLAMRYI